VKISLVAWTEANLNQVMEAHDWRPDYDTKSTAEDLLEAAGRVSYASWSRPNPGTATNATYLANLIRQNHSSIFEHVTATFWVREVSRNMLLELERHRHASFSVRSQRYVDERDAEFALGKDATRAEMELYAEVMGAASEAYVRILEIREARGESKKQRHQAARGVLPGATHTEFFVTANLRAWRYIIALRATEHADPEIREFAATVADLLYEKFPNAFQDLQVPNLTKDIRYFELEDK
jgi:thymidylate synthase (FAD)